MLTEKGINKLWIIIFLLPNKFLCLLIINITFVNKALSTTKNNGHTSNDPSRHQQERFSIEIKS